MSAATSTARWNVTDRSSASSTSCGEQVPSTSPSGVSTPTTTPFAPRRTAVSHVAAHHRALVVRRRRSRRRGAASSRAPAPRGRGQLQHRLDRPRRGGGAALRVVLAELDPVGAPHARASRAAPTEVARTSIGRSRVRLIGPASARLSAPCAFIWDVTTPATSSRSCSPPTCGPAGHDVVDHGAHALDPDDDYPAFCFAAAEAVVAEPGSLGVVLGGSGNGEQIAANKVPGVRAALAWSVPMSRAGTPAQRRQRGGHRRPDAHDRGCVPHRAGVPGGRVLGRRAARSPHHPAGRLRGRSLTCGPATSSR